MDSGEGEKGTAGEKMAVKICFDEATVKGRDFAVMHSDDCVNVYIPTCEGLGGDAEGEKAKVPGKIFLVNLDRVRGCA